MGHQHRGGDSPYAAGHRGNSLHNGRHCREVRIAAEAGAVPVYGHIQHGLAWSDMGGGQAVDRAGGGDDNIRLAGQRRRIRRLCMANGDGGVLPQEQHGHRTAYHRGTADDHSVPAAGGNAVVVQQRHAGLGGAGGKAPSLSGEHGGSALGRHTVHVLVRRQAGAEIALLPTQMGRQRPQQQAAVNGRVTVDSVDSCRHHIGGGIRGQGA